MKIPGPDHPITITANPKRVRVTAGNIVIADTTHALTLKEASYPAVQYVPRSDANMALLQRTERTTHCPYKGDASYYSVVADGKTLENSIWTYETPFPAMAEISGHLAFYPDKVKIEEVAEGGLGGAPHFFFFMPGFAPAIHVLTAVQQERRRWPGQARP